MSTVFIVIAIAAAAYILARNRALAAAGGAPSSLHSRPGHYAAYAALLAAGPAIALWVFWRIIEPIVLRSLVESSLPPDVLSRPPEMIST